VGSDGSPDDTHSDADTPVASGVLSLDASNLKLAGNGCSSSGDATVVASGGSLVATFNGVAVDLPSGSAQTADRRACALRIPAHVPRGYYLSRIVQSFPYRARKSSAASLSAAAHVALFSANPAVLTQDWARGSAVTAASTASQTTLTSAGSPAYVAWCNPQRAEDDVLAIDVAVSAQKDGASDDASISIDGIDVREGIELVFDPC
jgi:hypothetical protein